MILINIHEALRRLLAHSWPVQASAMRDVNTSHRLAAEITVFY